MEERRKRKSSREKGKSSLEGFRLTVGRVMGHFGAQKHPTEGAAEECQEHGFKWGDLFHSTQSVIDSPTTEEAKLTLTDTCRPYGGIRKLFHVFV